MKTHLPTCVLCLLCVWWRTYFYFAETDYKQVNTENRRISDWEFQHGEMGKIWVGSCRSRRGCGSWTSESRHRGPTGKPAVHVPGEKSKLKMVIFILFLNMDLELKI